jgi:predicted small lipoprotein YifL
MHTARVLRLLLAVFCLVSFIACGVKLPPVAPEHDPEPRPALNLDCSPQDENCDKTDPNYRPRKR